MAGMRLDSHPRKASAVVEGRGVFEGFAEPREAVGNPPSSKQKGPVLIEDFCIPALGPAVYGHPVPAQLPHQACITVVAPLDGGT